MAGTEWNYSAPSSETGYSADNSSSTGYSGFSGYSGYSGWDSNATNDWSSDDSSTPVATPTISLPGHTVEYMNKAAVSILGFVLACTFIGLFVDRVVLRRKLAGSPGDRPRGWVIGMLASSYVLLVPGLVCNLFSFKIAAMNGFQTFKEREENMLQFAHELWQYESYFGVLCIIGFAMVIPLVKLVLLTMGGVMRHSDDRDRVENARRAIHFVQIISKWASPDMFAYILLLYLIRKLNHPPLLNGLMNLDTGFSCFTIFCVFSTISSLGVRSPPKVRKEELTKRPGTSRTLIVVIIASIFFWVFLVLGANNPCMAMRLNFKALADSGQIDASMLPIVQSLHIDELAKDDVSVYRALGDLWDWSFPAGKGMEINCFFAWAMFGIFVLAFTVIDMFVLLLAAVVMHFSNTRPRILLEITHIFRKLSMLDVCVVGVIVIVLAGKIYEKMGVMLYITVGLWQLAAAEIAHYVCHYAVMRTGMRMRVSSSQSNEDLSESDSAVTSDEEGQTTGPEE